MIPQNHRQWMEKKTVPPAVGAITTESGVYSRASILVQDALPYE